MELAPATRPKRTPAIIRRPLFVLEGVAGVEAGETLHRAEPGQGILIPPNVEHRHVNAGDGILRFLGIFAPPTGNAADVRSRPPAENPEP